MIRISILSVQLYNYTDGHRKENDSIPSKTSHTSCQKNRTNRFSDSEGLFDRTLYSMWKAGMQMRRYSRSRSQILSFGQLSRPQARAVLCATRVPETGNRICSQLPEGKKDLRGDLQHQSRALKTERKNVKEPDGYPRRSVDPLRYPRFSNRGSQYAPELYSRSFRRDRFMGGDK
jgi:hypothetical protein